MKIALAPDLHCFYNTYSTADNSREMEWDACADRMYSNCVSAKADVLVAPGDFFTNPRPTASQVLKVASLFRRFENAGIRVIGINGNHDIGGSSDSSMNDVVDKIGNGCHWCAKDFSTQMVGEVGFALLPFKKDAKILSKNPEFATQLMAEMLVEKARVLHDELKKAGAKKFVLVGHWAIAGAGMSSGMSVSDKGEVVLSRKELMTQGWDACLFGHIHVPQVLEEKPFIAYSGAIQRIAMNEAGDERKFYIYNTEDDSYEEFPLPAIEMASIRGNIAEEADVDKFLQTVEDTDVDGKIVQVSYKIVKPLASKLKKKTIVDIIARKHASKLVGVIPHVVDPDVGRLDFNESIDNETALRKWCDVKGYGSDVCEKLVGIMKKFDKEAEI